MLLHCAVSLLCSVIKKSHIRETLILSTWAENRIALCQKTKQNIWVQFGTPPRFKAPCGDDPQVKYLPCMDVAFELNFWTSLLDAGFGAVGCKRKDINRSRNVKRFCDILFVQLFFLYLFSENFLN